jgi:hypothetical protein
MNMQLRFIQKSDEHYAFIGPAIECLLHRAQVEPENLEETKLRKWQEKEAL